MDGIRLSPKYGLNPTIPVCFFCGKQKNEIALLGRISNRKRVRTAWGGSSEQVFDSDVEAPRNMILDYEPCDECREKFKEGVLMIEVEHADTDEKRRRQIQDGFVPNGKYCLLKEEPFNNIFGNQTGITRKAGDTVLMEAPMVENFVNWANKQIKEQEDKEENKAEDVLNWEIERFEMPAHVTKVLKAADIDYVCEITDLTLSELKKINGLGKKSLDWILARLDYFGLKLREEQRNG